ncbi:hypothetical protein ACNQEO_06715 [Lactiplantibacillus argentoratensis]|uniref:hypothetical protein n=1 Tax=Lactiplantibacillus argentoratensis TaxID=271881 RepID=UPI003B28A959
MRRRPQVIPKSARIRIEFDAEVLRNEIFDVHDFADVDGHLAYQVGEDAHQIAYDQIAREWTITIR